VILRISNLLLSTIIFGTIGAVILVVAVRLGRSDATTAEKQIVANDLAAKVVAMSQSGDVILLAATIILRTGPLWNGRASTK
jgi:hypothetical protein